MARARKENHAASTYFESYAEYNRILRSWFVAFGAGGPALFLVEEKLRNALAASGETRRVVALFLCGVALQLLVAGLNKYANWYCYAGEDDADYQHSSAYRFWSGVVRQFLIDVVADLGTVVCFFSAVWILFGIFVK
jgi:hypothetical protein